MYMHPPHSGFFMRYLFVWWRDFSETCHKYSPWKWGSAEKFFKVKGQGYSETKCTFVVEACISVVEHGGSLVLQLK